MSTPLEDYAMIGDGQSAALVCKSGSIDWLCWPRFDSDACFAALLGGSQNGHWRLAPRDARAQITRRYREDTLILETDFSSKSGAVRIIDFMPTREDAPALVRVVTGLQGSAEMELILRLRFGYGAVPPWIELGEGRMVGKVGPDMIVLDADAPLSRNRHDVFADFAIGEGQQRAFVLRFAPSHCDTPGRFDAQRALTETQTRWRDWIARFKKPTHWPDAVKRSLIVLKALIDARTGGIVAAPTTSLPEVAGGEMNWDYRYCWLRDATFTVTALLNAGYSAEAQAWRDWILRTIAGTPEHIQVMYRLDGGRRVNEWTVPWLSGYRRSTPVRVGNAAAHQNQTDVYGELVDVMDLASQAGIERDAHSIAVEQAIVERIERVWREADHGIWEHRGEPRHYVYSQVMAWVAIDRFLRSKAAVGHAGHDLVRRMAALRAEIHREVCQEGFDSRLNSFVQYYGGQDIDASLLLIPAVGFLPAGDVRMAATVERIERELIEDGLVYRSSNSKRQSQGAFLACSCWLADCRQLQGRYTAARETFERFLAVRNDLGLLSEQYNLPGRRLTGNFPQALSHLALVTTALGLSGPVLQRGAG
jgi:GH15 family glucan-1,4-alpha-glucosidase